MTKSTKEIIENKSKLTVNITRFPERVDALSLLNYNETVTVEIGQTDTEEIKKVLAYSEIFTSLLRNNPEEMAEIFNNIISGKIDNARELADKIGFTEEAFQQQTGERMWFYIAVAGTIILGYAALSKPK